MVEGSENTIKQLYYRGMSLSFKEIWKNRHIYLLSGTMKRGGCLWQAVISTWLPHRSFQQSVWWGALCHCWYTGLELTKERAGARENLWKLYLNLTASNQQHSEHKGSAFLTPAKPHTTTTFAKSNLKS